MIKRYFNTSLFLFLLVPIFGQELSVSLEKRVLQIGEQTFLHYTIISPNALKNIRYEPHQKNFPTQKKLSLQKENDSSGNEVELEIIRPFSDTTYQENGKYIWSGKYLITAWDSADVILPPEPISINDSLFYFPADLLSISMPNAESQKDLYDIQEIFTELPAEKFDFIQFLKSYWWVFLVLILLLFSIFYYLSKKNKKMPPPLDIREVTLNKINLLEQGKGYEHNLKEYYFELSIILRRFLAVFFDSPIMDKTTPEINLILKGNQINPEIMKEIEKLLSHSDMVKFARSKPSLAEIQKVTEEARKVVQEIFKLKNENHA